MERGGEPEDALRITTPPTTEGPLNEGTADSFTDLPDQLMKAKWAVKEMPMNCTLNAATTQRNLALTSPLPAWRGRACTPVARMRVKTIRTTGAANAKSGENDDSSTITIAIGLKMHATGLVGQRRALAKSSCANYAAAKAEQVKMERDGEPEDELMIMTPPMMEGPPHEGTAELCTDLPDQLMKVKWKAIEMRINHTLNAATAPTGHAASRIGRGVTANSCCGG